MIEQAVGLEDVERAVLIPLAEATELPRITAETALLPKIRNGVQLPVEVFGASNMEQFQLLDEQGRLLAIVHSCDGHVVYDRVFLPA